MNGLVSVIIPTRNSARTLDSCLLSIKSQSYSNIETIVIDSKSTDNTIEIANQMQCKVICTDWSLLGSRYQGLRLAHGNYILMLDSDQILEKSAVERSVFLLEKYDMLFLEETPLVANTTIQKLFEADRRLIHKNSNIQTDPLRGAMLPRFYRRHILDGAFRSIPESLFPYALSFDVEIIYYEASRLSNKVAVVTHAVRHNEPSNLKELWRKNFRYGKNAKRLLRTGHYNDLLKQKTYNLRKTNSRISKDKILSSILLLLKAPPYLAGRYF